jgi:hypothetical protein
MLDDCQAVLARLRGKLNATTRKITGKGGGLMLVELSQVRTKLRNALDLDLDAPDPWDDVPAP